MSDQSLQKKGEIRGMASTYIMIAEPGSEAHRRCAEQLREAGIFTGEPCPWCGVEMALHYWTNAARTCA